MSKYVYLAASGENDMEDLLRAAKYVSNVLPKDEQEPFHNAFMEYYDQDNRQCNMDHGLTMLLVKHASIVLKKEEKSQNIDGFFTLLFFVMSENADDYAKLEESYNALIPMLTNAADGKAALRCTLLQKLFNTHPPEACQQYKVFKALLEYSAKAATFDVVIGPYLPYLESWLNSWRTTDAGKMEEGEDDALTSEEKAGICYTVSENCGADRLKWLKLYLKYTSQLSDHAVSAVRQVIVDAFNSNSIQSVDDLVSLPIVLKAEAKLPELVKLLKLFQTGTLDQLKQLHKQYPTIFTASGINEQDIYTRMYVMTLVSVCEGKTEVQLDDIKKGLGIEEVENIIVSAIGKGVVSGRIDHLRKVLVIQAVRKRTFKEDDWRQLGGQIDEWINKLTEIQSQSAVLGA